MIRAELEREDDVSTALRLMAGFVRDKVRPGDVLWSIGDREPDLFGAIAAPAPKQHAAPSVPDRIRMLAADALLHADPGRFMLMHRLLEKVTHHPRWLENAGDPDIRAAEALAKAVHRDKHKMKAFVRFREIRDEDGEPVFIAWFEPTHHIVRATAAFFANRFASMRWSILTPQACAHWDRDRLHFEAGANRADAPSNDALEETWRIYYRSTFNPARLKVKAMCSEMPRKYWRNLPEASLITPLIREAEARARGMIEAGATTPDRRIPDSARYVGPNTKPTTDMCGE